MRPALNTMRYNQYNNMHTKHALENNIRARIIALCAVNLVRKTLPVIFEREFLGFLHVWRLEHHAITPMACLPKQA